MIALIRWLGRLVLRIFFRQVAVVDGNRLPMDGPIILVANHPNALVDPLFFLALVPRRLSFLAKAPLFHMPVLGWIVRATGAIPVYRHQDVGSDTSRNRASFQMVHELLHRGGAVALFPEGVSHDDPIQRRFKTGAARLAIGAAATSPDHVPVRMVPVGLYYTAKSTFRSSAVLCYGEVIVVPPIPLDAEEEPPHDAVHALTTNLEYAIAKVTLQADQHEALDLIARAEEIFSSSSGLLQRDEALVDHFALRRRFLAGYTLMRKEHPARLAQLTKLIERYELELEHAHLSTESLVPTNIPVSRVIGLMLKRVAPMVVIAPLAFWGILVHLIPYRITGPLSQSMAKGSLDMVATIKILTSAALYPLSWLAGGFLMRWWLGPPWGLIATLASPLAGWAAMIFLERVTLAFGEIRTVFVMLFRPNAFRHLMAERRQVREMILALDRELPLPQQ